MKIFLPLNLFLLFLMSKIFAQNSQANSYPRQLIYFSTVHPIYTFYKNETVRNFDGSYTIGFPIGINTLKSDHFGYSFEITPFIKSENGVTKMNNVLFHPGVIFRRKNGFSINARLAFETSGRFGATAVFSKVIHKTAKTNYFIAIPIPLRLANERPASVGLGLQIGISIL
jgi:hypothetical protein